ncbi:DUF1173 family protein [Nocardia gipuzkoensis]
MDYVDWVQLAERKIRLDEVRGDPDHWVRLLSAARTNRSAVCLCRPQPLRLVTRCSAAGRHSLAVWPLEGPLHDARCAFHHIDQGLSGRGGYSSTAIREIDGEVWIRFSAPLESKASDSPQSASMSVLSSRGSRSTVGLVGLLHHWWDGAKLNSWQAGRKPRRWSEVAAALSEQVDASRISRRPGSEVVYVVPPFREEAAAANTEAFDQFVESLRAGRNRVRRGFVLGEIKEFEKSKHGFRYQLAQQRPRPRGYIYVSATVHEQMQRSFRSAFSEAARSVRGRKVVLFYVERSPGGYVTGLDAAVMLTNTGYVPADSSYEVRMADALITAGRSFTKPLIFDANADAVFPDFVLTDEATTDSFVEVWGLPGRAEYEARKREKTGLYQQAGARLIEWTVTEPMPSLARDLGGGRYVHATTGGR